jgi:hypothetical protein
MSGNAQQRESPKAGASNAPALTPYRFFLPGMAVTSAARRLFTKGYSMMYSMVFLQRRLNPRVNDYRHWLQNIHHHHHHHHWQNSTYCAIAFLRRFCQIWSGFHLFRFQNTIFFYRARSSALRPTSNLENLVAVFMTPSDRVAQLYLQVSSSLFVAFCDSQEGGILTGFHMMWLRNTFKNCLDFANVFLANKQQFVTQKGH